MQKTGFTVVGEYHSCNCVGPKHGQPLCPCLMKNVVIKDGRYIIPEKDLGPVICGKMGEYNDLICVRSHDHEGEHNYMVKK